MEVDGELQKVTKSKLRISKDISESKLITMTKRMVVRKEATPGYTEDIDHSLFDVC